MSDLCAIKYLVQETAARCSGNLSHCSNNQAFLSDGFQIFQKIYDSICPGAWFLGVNLGFTTFVLL